MGLLRCDRFVQRCAVVASLAASGCGSESETTTPDAGPADGCGPDQVALEDGGCFSPGIPAELCAPGFEPDDGGGCTPILPPESCADGEIAVPGDAECHEIVACGDGPWGEIPVEGNTQHVDSAYGGSDSDGTADRPWTTISAAVTAAEPGAIVAIAAGSYLENIMLDSKPLRLWGRCPTLVEVVGSPPALATIDILADHSEVRHLAVRTASSEPAAPVTYGISSTRAEGVVLEGLWVHDTSGRGVNAEDSLGPSEVTVLGSVIERAREAGAMSLGAQLTLSGSVIRGTMGNVTAHIRGVSAEINLNSQNAGTVAIVGSVVERNKEVGVLVSGSTLTIDDSVVRDTFLRDDGTWGIGVIAQEYPQGAPETSITGSVLERHRLAGVVATGGVTLITRTVVAHNESQTADGLYGRGITCEPSLTTTSRGEVHIAASKVDDNQEAGIAFFACDGTIDATIVRATRPRSSDQTRGRGINIQSVPTGERGTAWIGYSLITENHSIGLLAFASNVTIDRATVRDTQPLADGRFGDGLLAMADAKLTVLGVRVDGNARAGIANFGSTVEIAQAKLECNPIQLNGEEVDFPYVFHDLGGNSCGCDGQPDECKVQSIKLEPPGDVDPTQ
ncbi:MAG: hypothetical protein JRI68_05030 [Deltaproteobacteria bacterium]|nr:hypothetical protein [Deltaproteobacteria bacterium]